MFHYAIGSTSEIRPSSRNKSISYSIFSLADCSSWVKQPLGAPLRRTTLQVSTTTSPKKGLATLGSWLFSDLGDAEPHAFDASSSSNRRDATGRFPPTAADSHTIKDGPSSTLSAVRFHR